MSSAAEDFPEQVNDASVPHSEADIVKNGLVRALRPEAAVSEDDETTPLDHDDTQLQQDHELDNPVSEESEEPEYDANSDGLYQEAVDQFMAKAGRYKLLTAAEEVRYAKAMERGALAQTQLDELMESGEPVSPEIEKTLQDLIKDGSKAKEMMINSNLRLVLSVVKGYKNHGVPLGDLIQEGVLGMVRAAEKFDWRKGYKFSTYATWWIRQAAQRSVANTSRTIRMPVHVAERVFKVRKAEKSLMAELGRDPTIQEIAENAYLPISQVEEVLEALRIQPVSLNVHVGEDEETELGDYYDPAEDRESEIIGTEEQAERNLIAHQVSLALEQLSPRNRTIIEMRFGIGGQEPQSLQAIGKALDLTRERVRQLETETIRKLSSNPLFEGLESE